MNLDAFCTLAYQSKKFITLGDEDQDNLASEEVWAWSVI